LSGALVIFLGVSSCGEYAAIDMGRELIYIQGFTVCRNLVASHLLKVAEELLSDFVKEIGLVGAVLGSSIGGL